MDVESISGSIVRSHMENMDIGERTGSRIREISPCSEYARYTVEGTFKDPYSDLSVILDTEVMGFLFINSGLKRAKWSNALGYGMAMAGDETRIHVHRNGKYIIRRALDRKDAERSFKTIASVLWPAVFSSRSDSFNWSIMRNASWKTENGIPGEPEMLIWPDEEGEHEEVFYTLMKVINRLDKTTGVRLRNMITEGIVESEDVQGSLLASIVKERDRNGVELRSEIKDGNKDPLEQKGAFTYHLWLDMGLSNLIDYIKGSPSGFPSWMKDSFWTMNGDGEELQEEAPRHPIQNQLKKAVYLLGPVMGTV